MTNKALKWITLVAMALLLCVSVLGYLPDFDWRASLASHPRPQYLVAAIVLTIWFAVRQNSKLITVSLLIVGLNGIAIAPLFFHFGSEAQTPQFNPNLAIDLIHLNTNRGQADLSPIQQATADILFLQEVTPDLAAKLPSLLPDYQLVYEYPHPATQGSAIWQHTESAVRVLSTNVIHLPADSTRPILTSVIEIEKRQIRLLNLHVIRPRNVWTDAVQQAEYAAVAEWSRRVQQEEGMEVVIAGDFNATPWSYRFRQLLTEGALQNSLVGFGLQNTWPGALPLAIGLPIDHALTSSGITTLARQTEAVRRSDHGLIQITFGIQLV